MREGTFIYECRFQLHSALPWLQPQFLLQVLGKYLSPIGKPLLMVAMDADAHAVMFYLRSLIHGHIATDPVCFQTYVSAAFSPLFWIYSH